MRQKVGKFLLSAVALTAMCLCFAWGQGLPSEAESARANAPSLTARLVPDSIVIGDHFTLELTITKDIVQQVLFPDFSEGKLAGEIEVLAQSDVDTLSRDGRTVTIGKKYVLTVFDEGYYGLGRFPMMWVDKNISDTIYSADSLFLTVTTFDVDLESQTINDIKPVVEAPFHPMEIAGWLAVYLFVVRPIVIAIAVLCIFSRRRRRGIFGGKRKPGEPPHVVAIRDLEILHNQKLWQNERHKVYYTRITDILREYLEGRYGVQAMEMTSEEIVKALAGAEIGEKSRAELGEVLGVSDLVKFAKYVPDGDTNEKCYFSAYYFVENTKPSEVEQTPSGEDDELKPYE